MSVSLVSKQNSLTDIFQRNSIKSTHNVNQVWLTVVPLIQIAALITLNSEAKQLVSSRVIISDKLQLGRELKNNEQEIQWTFLTTSKKIVLLMLGFVFGIMPFLARLTVSRKNDLPIYFVQHNGSSVTLRKENISKSIFSWDNAEDTEIKFAKDLVRKKERQNELLALKERFRIFIASDRELNKLFYSTLEKHPNDRWIGPRIPDQYDRPCPKDALFSDQWVHVGCQNINIQSDIRRLADFMASFRQVSLRFTHCYQERMQTHPEEVEGFAEYCTSVFKEAATPVHMEKVDNSDEYLEQILTSVDLHNMSAELRVSWVSLTSELPVEIDQLLAPLFEQFVTSLEIWYQMMMDGNFIKNYSSNLFKTRSLKKLEIDITSFSDLDQIIVKEATRLLDRKAGGGNKFSNWQNVLRRMVLSSRVQAIAIWQKQFFLPLKQILKNPTSNLEKIKSEVELLMKQKDDWEKYIDKQGSGVRLRLQELTGLPL